MVSLRDEIFCTGGKGFSGYCNDRGNGDMAKAKDGTPVRTEWWF